MARLPQFTRKGPPKAPALMIAIGDKGKDAPPMAHDEPDGDEGADDGPEEADDVEQQDPKDIAVCPACGCTFNDETGKVLKESHPQHPANQAGGTPAGGGDNDEAGAEGY